MASIIVRMVVSDLVFVLGVMLLLQPGDATKLVTPIHLLGMVAAAAGVAYSGWMTVALIRYAQKRRGGRGQSLAADDREWSGYDSERRGR